MIKINKIHNNIVPEKLISASYVKKDFHVLSDFIFIDNFIRHKSILILYKLYHHIFHLDYIRILKLIKKDILNGKYWKTSGELAFISSIMQDFEKIKDNIVMFDAMKHLIESTKNLKIVYV